MGACGLAFTSTRSTFRSRSLRVAAPGANLRGCTACDHSAVAIRACIAADGLAGQKKKTAARGSGRAGGMREGEGGEAPWRGGNGGRTGCPALVTLSRVAPVRVGGVALSARRSAVPVVGAANWTEALAMSCGCNPCGGAAPEIVAPYGGQSALFWFAPGFPGTLR